MNNPYVAALDFLIDAGVTVALMDEPNDRFKPIELARDIMPSEVEGHQGKNKDTDSSIALASTHNDTTLKSHTETIAEAEKLVAECNTLDDLKTAIQNFDGLGLKKTATNLVFADGNPNAKIMVIGEAPGADEDRQGMPFVGITGQLLDNILKCINLSRTDNVYITNILNWRPPGNRTPTKEEMDIATPFILKHIDLVKPDYIILCGGVAAQTLLKSKESISRLRGKIHELDNGITAIATYHPAFLLRTPLQKKKVWDDMLMFKGLLDA